jgi:signal transduction histidine kinase
VQFVETQLAGAIGSASARVMVASVVEEEALGSTTCCASWTPRRTSRARAGHCAARANEQLKSLDRLKDDFMSSVTHELRTPLTSIRALAELMSTTRTCPPRSASSSWASWWPRPSA